MSSRSIVTSCVALAAAWAIAAGAPPALASNSITATSSGGLQVSPLVMSGTAFTVTDNTDVGVALSVYGSVAGAVKKDPGTAFETTCDTSSDCRFPAMSKGLTFTFSVASSSTSQTVFLRYGSTTPVGVTVLPTVVPDDDSATPSAGPAALLQQVPRQSDGLCDVIDRPELNWSGVSSGGWGPSWSRWINDGAGGPVCTRELRFDQSRQRWVVNERTL